MVGSSLRNPVKHAACSMDIQEAERAVAAYCVALERLNEEHRLEGLAGCWW